MLLPADLLYSTGTSSGHTKSDIAEAKAYKERHRVSDVEDQTELSMQALGIP